MIKKDYLKPEMQVVKIQHHSQILAGSVKTVTTKTNGQEDDDEDELKLPDTGQPTTGSVWDDAI